MRFYKYIHEATPLNQSGNADWRGTGGASFGKGIKKYRGGLNEHTVLNAHTSPRCGGGLGRIRRLKRTLPPAPLPHGALKVSTAWVGDPLQIDSMAASGYDFRPVDTTALAAEPAVPNMHPRGSE
jgi:hypothetical protein